MKLSIVVPVYKVEKYLDKCVESILSQTYTDYEVILVDDGSPDRCGELCDLWAERDSRIRVVHKENGGLSDARNAGIDVARGEYIGLVDSDDYIREDMFEVLISNMEQYDADLSMCGYADVYATGIRGFTDDDTVYVWDRKEATRQILLGKLLSVHATVKLYKRSLFDGVRYPKGKISEDAHIILDILDGVECAVFTPRTEYYYVHRGGSINTSMFRPVDRTRIEAHYQNYQRISKQYPDMARLAFDRYLGAIGFVAHKVAMTGDKKVSLEQANLFHELRKNLSKVLTSSYFSTKRKLSTVVLVTSQPAYRWLMERVYQTVD